MELFDSTVLKMPIYSSSTTSVLPVSSTHQYYPTVQDEKAIPQYLIEMEGEKYMGDCI